MSKKLFVALMLAGSTALTMGAGVAGAASEYPEWTPLGAANAVNASARTMESVFDRRLRNRVSKVKWNALRERLKMAREPEFADNLAATYEKEGRIITAHKMKNGNTHQYWAKAWGIGEDKSVTIKHVVLSPKKAVLSAEFVSLDSGGRLYDYIKLKKGWRFECWGRLADYYPSIARKLNIAYCKSAALTRLLLKALKI